MVRPRGAGAASARARRSASRRRSRAARGRGSARGTVRFSCLPYRRPVAVLPALRGRDGTAGAGTRAKSMDIDLRFAATAFATALTIIDPVGMIPLSVAATAGAAPAHRRAIVDRAIAVAAGVILLSGLVGRQFLDALGIGLPAF